MAQTGLQGFLCAFFYFYTYNELAHRYNPATQQPCKHNHILNVGDMLTVGSTSALKAKRDGNKEKAIELKIVFGSVEVTSLIGTKVISILTRSFNGALNCLTCQLSR